MDTVTNSLKNLSLDEKKKKQKTELVQRTPEQPQLPDIIADVQIKNKDVTKTDIIPYEITSEQASNLEAITRNQGRSDLWKNHHKGRLTSSLFGKIQRCKSGQEGLVSQIMGYSQPPEYLRSLKWGRDNEEKARKAFIKTEENKHKGFRVKPIGLVVDPEVPHLGTSPDGIVECDCCSSATLEIKCPYSCKDLTINECLKRPTFYLNQDRTLKKSHEYYAQIQGQMAICRLNRAYFVVFTLKDIHIEIIDFDKEFWSKLEDKLYSFFHTQIVPELKDKNLQKKLVGTINSCPCQGKVTGVVITCSKCHNNFHLKCVQLRRTPKKDWFCAVCLSSNPSTKIKNK